ncbi:hypothetical protein [Psychroserpens sp.]|uniref:hypothetical protein n=1 Tax=Psychroserpens sp. TaxID=2020870 RepID=UPI001B0C710E|nr:hypothetical protein [Psychroserpens sp.]MBO6605427.1 hypothetical protein [Psychroserpens sp.]MBO6630066.1 hypothetical protein [Psychroserpens sp.]MBO6653764.1 hypothetical protein [Psychroserpens sp.]MBO6682085.1 hypothetical protein [Psychroserpens sp.]MBO6748801.1 hypothetical protein [Psychroserpens sp.]
MDFLKRLFTSSILLLVMASFSQCSSVPKLQKEAPISIADVYYQEWIAGVQGGGSGINLFISVSDSDITLETVYFRGEVAKLEVKPSNPNQYIGRFKTEMNQPKDIILSSDPKEEYGNKMPQKKDKFPFELADNECVISYTVNDEIKYFKISNIKNKPVINYPSAGPKQD